MLLNILGFPVGFYLERVMLPGNCASPLHREVPESQPCLPHSACHSLQACLGWVPGPALGNGFLSRWHMNPSENLRTVRKLLLRSQHAPKIQFWFQGGFVRLGTKLGSQCAGFPLRMTIARKWGHWLLSRHGLDVLHTLIYLFLMRNLCDPTHIL